MDTNGRLVYTASMSKVSEYRLQQNSKIAEKAKALYATGMSVRDVAIVLKKLGHKKSKSWVGNIVKELRDVENTELSTER